MSGERPPEAAGPGAPHHAPDAAAAAPGRDAAPPAGGPDATSAAAGSRAVPAASGSDAPAVAPGARGAPSPRPAVDNRRDAVCTLHRGDRPLLVSLPHVGTELPADQHGRYLPRALAVEDTDWHLERLYGFVRGLGVSLLVPRYSRYLIDLNRPPEDAPMYPGINNTELCPTRFFTGEPLYREGRAPDAAEIARRVDRYWRPYHRALEDELERLRARHGHVVLFEGHSIRSELPWLFEGRLPDLNLGTVDGHSCAPSLRESLAAVLASQDDFSHVVDGRFKGGYITRHYGRPQRGVHAVQLEMCWKCYMAEGAPYAYDEARGEAVRPLIRRLVDAMLAWSPNGR